MPLYEYYCPECARKFELLRPLAQMDAPAGCPQGHKLGARVLSLFTARVGTMDRAGETAFAAGGCACGGNCSCGSSH